VKILTADTTIQKFGDGNEKKVLYAALIKNTVMSSNNLTYFV